jgi:hypothetical protein
MVAGAIAIDEDLCREKWARDREGRPGLGANEVGTSVKNAGGGLRVDSTEEAFKFAGRSWKFATCGTPSARPVRSVFSDFLRRKVIHLGI